MREKKQLRSGLVAVLLVAFATVVAPPARAGIIGVISSGVQVYTVTQPGVCGVGNPGCGALPVQPIAALDTFTPLWVAGIFNAGALSFTGAGLAALLAGATPAIGAQPGVNMVNGLGGVNFTFPNVQGTNENLDGDTAGTGAVTGGFTPNPFGFNTSTILYTPPTMTELAGLQLTDSSAYVILLTINFNVAGGILPSLGISQVAGVCNNNSASPGDCLIAGGVAEYGPTGYLGGSSFTTGDIPVPANGGPLAWSNTQFVGTEGFIGNGVLQEDAYLVLQGDPLSIDVSEDQFTDGVPEPATCALMACGLGLVALARRRRS